MRLPPMTTRRWLFALVMLGTAALVSVAAIIAGFWPKASSRHSNDPRGVTCLAFSPDGTTLVAGRPFGGLTLWDAGARKETATAKGHNVCVLAVAFSPDGKTVATGGCDGTARMWDIPGLRERAVLRVPAAYVPSLAFSPDGGTLYTGDFHGDQGVREWDVTTGTERAVLFKVQGPTGVQCLALSPDGKTLASTGHDWGGTVQLWDVAAGARSAILASGEPGQRIQVTHLVFSPDGKTLATVGGEDSRLRLWDVGNRELLRIFGNGPGVRLITGLLSRWDHPRGWRPGRDSREGDGPIGSVGCRHGTRPGPLSGFCIRLQVRRILPGWQNPGLRKLVTSVELIVLLKTSELMDEGSRKGRSR